MRKRRGGGESGERRSRRLGAGGLGGMPEVCWVPGRGRFETGPYVQSGEGGGAVDLRDLALGYPQEAPLPDRSRLRVAGRAGHEPWATGARRTGGSQTPPIRRRGTRVARERPVWNWRIPGRRPTWARGERRAVSVGLRGWEHLDRVGCRGCGAPGAPGTLGWGSLDPLRRKSRQRVQAFQADVTRSHMQRPGLMLRQPRQGPSVAALGDIFQRHAGSADDLELLGSAIEDGPHLAGKSG